MLLISLSQYWKCRCDFYLRIFYCLVYQVYKNIYIYLSMRNNLISMGKLFFFRDAWTKFLLLDISFLKSFFIKKVIFIKIVNQMKFLIFLRFILIWISQQYITGVLNKYFNTTSNYYFSLMIGYYSFYKINKIDTFT